MKDKIIQEPARLVVIVLRVQEDLILGAISQNLQLQLGHGIRHLDTQTRWATDKDTSTTSEALRVLV